MHEIVELFGQTAQTIPFTQTVLTLLLSLVLGIVIGMTYKISTEIADYSRNFFLTLILSPAVIGAIILLIGSDVAKAFSLAGAFSIIRFRSAPGNPKDITYVLFAMAAGLACGAGYFVYAAIFTAVLCAVMVAMYKTGFGSSKTSEYILKISIPESLNFKGIFDEILNEYTVKSSLTRIKTVDMGSVFELDYSIELKNQCDIKEFVDKIRCRNGNLTVLLSMADTSREF